MKSLDLGCSEFGRMLSTIDKLDEKLLQDSLSVLDEKGLYAFFLYLKAHGKVPGGELSAKCHQFLLDNPVVGQKFHASAFNDVFNAVVELGQNIDDLIFARELIMRALVYARYHFKAEISSRNET
jgi:hypothetical protein